MHPDVTTLNVTPQEKARRLLVSGLLWTKACGLSCPAFLESLRDPDGLPHNDIREQISLYLQGKPDYGAVDFLLMGYDYYLQNISDVEEACLECLESCVQRSIGDGISRTGLRELFNYRIPTNAVARLRFPLQGNPPDTDSLIMLVKDSWNLTLPVSQH